MPTLLTIQQAAEQLGITKQTLYVWVKDKKIPYVRIPAGTLRFNQDHLDKWVTARTIKSNIGDKPL